MLRSARHLGILLFVLLAAGCRPGTPTITDATPPAAATPPSACQVVSAGEGVMVYTRPSVKAGVFASLSAAQYPVALSARTADGWLGFEPGVAQAANRGVFRLRWVLASQVQVSGDCQTLPEVVGPPPGVCFTMPMEDTAVYVKADDAADVVTMLFAEQYAAIQKIDAKWAKLDSASGNSGIKGTGWVPRSSLNLNGPCDQLFVDAATARLRAHGVVPWGVEGDGGSRWVKFYDPAGNLVELVQFENPSTPR